MKSVSKLLVTVAGAALAIAAPSAAQQVPLPEQDEINTAAGLNLDDNIVILGEPLPTVVKATAIVNGEIITQTDINQRAAMSLIGSPEGAVPPEQVELLRQQVLSNLIDETLQIQAAQKEEITVSRADIDTSLQRVAENAGMTVEELGTYLEQGGASVRTVRRQIEGELAWQRLQQVKIASTVTVGDEEVQGVIDKIEASKGQTEWNVSEIFLSSTPATDDVVQQRATQLLNALRGGTQFAALARQYSESSAAATGGNLGWVRPEQLPPELGRVLNELQPGAVSVPIKIPGGYSILAVQDRRTILSADPRDAVLTVKQISMPITPGTSLDDANALVDRFALGAQSIGGCGNAETFAAGFGAQVVTQDGIRIRDLPPALQQMVTPLQVGQATRPFGSLDEAARLLVICGRDEATPGLPGFAEVQSQIEDERVNRRARRYLRDLRRDAIIDFR